MYRRIPERFMDDCDPEPRDRPSPEEYAGLMDLPTNPEFDKLIRPEDFDVRIPPRS